MESFILGSSLHPTLRPRPSLSSAPLLGTLSITSLGLEMGAEKCSGESELGEGQQNLNWRLQQLERVTRMCRAGGHAPPGVQHLGYLFQVCSPLSHTMESRWGT